MRSRGVISVLAAVAGAELLATEAVFTAGLGSGALFVTGVAAVIEAAVIETTSTGSTLPVAPI